MKARFSHAGFCCVFAVVVLALLDATVPVHAAVTVSGTVKDNQAVPIAGTTVQAIDPSTQQTVVSTTTDAAGYYTLYIAPGTYDFKVTPPSGSQFGPAVALGQTVTVDKVLNFVLVPAGSAILSGRLLDALGSGVPNQNVQLSPAGTYNPIQQVTDASGNYSFQVAPGDYSLVIYSYVYDPNSTLNIPRFYYLSDIRLSLTQSTILDLPLPLKQVRVHVQDPNGSPVAGVNLTTNESVYYNLPVGAVTASYGYSAYYYWLPPATTNSSGDATLWLFPDGPYTDYTITASPPSGSSLANTSLSNVSFTSDTSLTITLQQALTLTGRVLDGLGSGVPNQNVQLSPAGTYNPIQQVTDASGNYSFQVAPGDYSLVIYSYVYDPNSTLNIPRFYYLSDIRLSLTQSTILDLPLPLKQVRVHVQDPNGSPVAGVNLTTNESVYYNLPVGTVTASYGYSAYYYWLPPAMTNSSGDATLWLFPDGPYTDYTITANPPAGSGLVAFNVHEVRVASDMTIVVVLQFAQPPPQRSCPLSQGFWKTHSELWPVTSLVLGSQTYTQSELLTLLNTPVKGDASLILAYQLIAAKLSVAAGSDPAPVASTISGADSVLSTFPGKLPYAVKTSSATGKTMTSYAETLESYNNGMLTSTCVPATFTSITSSSQQQAIHDLAADVQALVASGVLNRGQGNSLTMKLEMANNQVGQGKGKTASNLMRAFIHEVVALTQAGVLSPAVRGSLISKADSIIVQLGG